MINLSFDELKLIAQIRNISGYENKSKEDLIKALSEPKPKQTPKPQTTPETKPESKPKPETKPKQTPKQTPKSKPEIRINKRKFKKFRNNFDEYRKAFYNVKN